MPRNRVWLVALLVAGLLGIALFGALAWRAVDVEHIATTEAEDDFEEALATVPSRTPLVWRDEQGGFVRGPQTPAVGPRPTQLHILAYHVDGQRLVRADVPIWFFKIKGPAVGYALRGTGFDMATLGLTASDLERAGARVVLDEVRSTGDRMLAWTN